LGFHPFIKENHALMEIGVCAKMETWFRTWKSQNGLKMSTKLWGQPIFRLWSQAPQHDLTLELDAVFTLGPLWRKTGASFRSGSEIPSINRENMRIHEINMSTAFKTNRE
jgi:hypothetical protein